MRQASGPVGTSRLQKRTTHKSRRPDCPVSEVITQAPSVGVITKNLSHVGENQEARSANVGNATPALPATKLTKEVNSPSAPDVLVLFAKPKRANLDFENVGCLIGSRMVQLIQFCRSSRTCSVSLANWSGRIQHGVPLAINYLPFAAK